MPFSLSAYLLISINIIWLFLPRQTQRLVSLVIPDPVKLTLLAITRVECLAAAVKLGEGWDFKRMTNGGEGCRGSWYGEMTVVLGCADGMVGSTAGVPR